MLREGRKQFTGLTQWDRIAILNRLQATDERTALRVPKWRNWQTRMVQVHVLARVWRFESSFRHQLFGKRDASASRLLFAASLALAGRTAGAGRCSNLKTAMSAASADPTHLDRIVARTRLDLSVRMAATDRTDLERAAANHQPRGFAAALRSIASTHPAVIAELKKASPSKGLIRADFDPAARAATLQQAGAATLSVLTDEPFFQGSLRNLEIASQRVSIPCLRKDFMVDPFQVVEARAHGADAVLLIVAALSDGELRTLRNAARDAELDVLCEVHSPEEIDRALPLECELYGVNTRDLRTFHVDSDAALHMASMLPKQAVRVGESGIRNAEDIARMTAAGFDAFLIGETLMRAADPGAALQQLLAPNPSKRSEATAVALTR